MEKIITFEEAFKEQIDAREALTESAVADLKTKTCYITEDEIKAGDKVLWVMVPEAVVQDSIVYDMVLAKECAIKESTWEFEAAQAGSVPRVSPDSVNL